MKHFLATFIACFAIVIICNSQANQKLSNLIAPTAINVQLSPDANNTRSLGAINFSWRNLYLRGDIYLDGLKYLHNTGAGNTFMGLNAGRVISTGTANTASGFEVLFANTTGSYNTGIGNSALHANKDGWYNTAGGFEALYNNTGGLRNTATGSQTLYSNTTGNYNTASGSRALFENTTGNFNSAFGINALRSNTSGIENTASGAGALTNNTYGVRNTANGTNALYLNTVGYHNTASGNSALYSNTDGYSNTACGHSALYSNTFGVYNTATGENALHFNTDGWENTASGYYALYSNKGGSGNTASGVAALSDNESGYSNSAFGAAALAGNVSGAQNTVVGVAAISNNISGNDNTAIGAFANVLGENLNNTSLFGANAYATADNQVRIGNDAVTSIGGYASWTTLPSDERAKKNIQPNVPGLTFINKLKPLTYNLDLDAIDKIVQRPAIRTREGKLVEPTQKQIEAKKQKEQITYTGFIAQDVQKAAKEINYDFSGVDAAKNDKDLYGIRYADFVVPLVKAVQELDKKTQEIDELKQQVKELKEMILKLAKGQATAIKPANASHLYQNIPNPANGKTTIRYHIQDNAGPAQILVTDAKGSTVKIFGALKGSNKIDIRNPDLASGVYTYTLYVDNKRIGSKQMIITK